MIKQLLKMNTKIIFKTPFIWILSLLALLFYIFMTYASLVDFYDVYNYLPVTNNFLVFCFLVLPLISYSRDTTNNYLIINLSLPVKRKNIVTFRFLNIFLFSIFCLLLCFFTYFARVNIEGLQINYDFIRSLIIINLLTQVLLSCIYTIFYFSCGSSYSFKNYVTFLFCGFIFFPIIRQIQISKMIFNFIVNNSLYGLLISIVIFITSYIISYLVFNKKDIM